MQNDAKEGEKDKIDLASIKKDIESAWNYFSRNYKRYNHFYKFVFETSLSQEQREILRKLGKPDIEFNICEAYISRLRGEFSKQEPSIDVHPAEGMRLGRIDDNYLKLVEVIQAHLNEIFFECNNDEFTYDIYSDTLAGGFSVAEVSTDYVSERSFLQKICIEKVKYPTLCGFDPLAKESHKGDGRYCFKLFPMTKEEFEIEYGKDKAKHFNFTRSVESFNWSYINNDQEIVLLADYYCKVQEKVTLVRLANDEELTLAEYNQKYIRDWDSIEQAPVILEKRKSTKTRIDRYRICQEEVLSHDETFYPMLPLIFIDGNSVMIQNTEGGQLEQLTRPYIYHAEGIQELHNYAGQAVGQELLTMPQQRFMIPVEGIPKQYEKVYQQPQLPAFMPYNQVDPKNPQNRLDPPQVIARPPSPPIIWDTFVQTPQLSQGILGTYDAILGINGQEISGKAIQQGAMQSNASAIPYLMGYIKGIERCAQVIIHLLPLIYVTPRSIPIRLPNGKRDFQIINKPYPKEDKQAKLLAQAQEAGMSLGNELPEEKNQEQEEFEPAIMFNYNPHDLNVRITPGVNSQVQKQLAMEQLTSLMQASPVFAEFMNRQGLPVLIENLEIQGVEGLKQMAEAFQAQMMQEQQAAAQQPAPEDKIAQAEIQKAQLEAQAVSERTHAQLAIDSGKLALEKEKVENDRLEIELKAAEMQAKLDMEAQSQASEDAREAIRATMEAAKLQHEMTKGMEQSYE